MKSLIVPAVFSDALKNSMPSWLSSGKLRASVASIGKDAPPYSTSIDYVPDGLPINGVTLWTQNNSAGVQDLKPEFTTTYEAGADLGFLKDRAGLSFTWYHSVSKDQILGVQTAASTGFTSITLNAGAIQNKEVELTAHATPVKSTSFSWDIAVNFSANKNKVLSIYHGLGSLVIGPEFDYGGSSPTFKYIVWQPVSDIFGTYYERYYGSGKTGDSLFTDKGKPMIIGANGFPVRAPQSDQKILGNSQPKWIGSINNSFTYKNWNLSFLIDTRQGIQKYNQLDNFMSAFGIAAYTENRDQMVVFPGVLTDGSPNTKSVYLGQGTGPDGVHYGAGYYRNVYRGVTENFVQNANWVRLRSLSLSYNLPPQWLKHAFISRASVSFTGYNLWLNTPYNGFDPEASDAAAGDPTASMQKLNVPADSIALYLSNPAIAVGAVNLTLQDIMAQKYVACFLSPVTWVDMRCMDYNYKGFALPVGVPSGTQFIRRMDYPQSEITRNSANVPDYQRTDHLWWDK